ncbi:MAG: hypothetical protein CMF35_14090 [Leeuwenhoekiella sp.]|nr:hypothetical protein [Leeuwenhoekiella sp.]HCW65209.1 hypothetical protein [Leeuwenhoekiella sp.]
MGRLLFFDLSNDTNLNLSVYEKPCFEHMFRFLIKYQCIANGKDRKIKFYLSKIDSKLHSQIKLYSSEFLKRIFSGPIQRMLSFTYRIHYIQQLNSIN